MNVGLLYTPVSIYQMTRGALVLFVGVLSVIFLSRRLYLYQWLSLVTVMIGVSIVGLSGSLVKQAVTGNFDGQSSSETEEAAKVMLGVSLIIFAQIFTATQFVVEEKIMARYSVEPLVAVGFEGVFGFISILLFIPVLYLFRDASPFLDLPRGWNQMVNTSSVLWAGLAVAISISLFNFFGLSVTRHVSATARSLTDTCRTLSIWLISLGLGWEHFLVPISFLQVAGFSLLVYGTFLFNDLVAPPKILRPSSAPGYMALPQSEEDAEAARAALAEEHLDETAGLPAQLGQSGYDVLPPPSNTDTTTGT